VGRSGAALLLAASLPLSIAPLRAQPPPPIGLIERLAPASDLIQRLAPPGPSRPAPLPPPPAAAAPREGPGATLRLTLASVSLTGATALPEARLAPLIAPLLGGEVTLGEIEAARVAILTAYRAAGFPYVAVRALLEAGPRLHLQVIEGVVTSLLIDPPDLPAAPLLRRLLAPLIGQAPLSQTALERALLLAAEVPGLTPRALLRPAEQEGALELVVRVAQAPLSGFVTLDNRGQRGTGAWQGLAVAGVNSRTRWGERAEAALLQTDGFGQSYGQATLDAFLGGSGLRGRVQAGMGRVAPGGGLAALGYAGQTQLVSLGLAWPLVRRRPLSVTLDTSAEALDSLVEVKAGGPATRLTRDAVRALRLGLEATAQDGWLPGPAIATTQARLRLHQGIEALGATHAGGNVARAGSDFGFTRLSFGLSRVQPLAEAPEGALISLFVEAGGQASDAVLPPAERFQLGGNRLGRGYFAGQVGGDRALAGTVELRLDLPGAGPQFYAFHDQGRAWSNRAGEPSQRLSAQGLGVRLPLGGAAQAEAELVTRAPRLPEGDGSAQAAQALFVRLLVRF